MSKMTLSTLCLALVAGTLLAADQTAATSPAKKSIWQPGQWKRPGPNPKAKLLPLRFR